MYGFSLYKLCGLSHMTELLDRLGISIDTHLTRPLLFLGLLILVWIARRLSGYLVRRIIHFVVQAVHLVGRRQINIELELVQALTAPIQLLVTIIGVRIALLVFDLDPVTARFVSGAFSILLAYTFFWALYRLAEIIGVYLVRVAEQATSSFDETVVRFSSQVVRVVIVAFGVVVVAQQLGYDLGGVLAGLGLGGLAVALAAQDSLANLIGYVAIISDSTYKVGDLIQIEEIEGFIEDISLRSTRVRKRDRSLVLLPNQFMANHPITNWSRLRRRQIRMTIGVTYSTTADQMEALLSALRSMLQNHEKVVPDTVMAEFVEFGSSSLDILLIGLVKVVRWEELQALKTDINLRIMRLLVEQGLEIAFPTRTVWIEPAASAPISEANQQPS
ncbi:MAG: mechanosensitive ion channel [Anaerolineae bacterium]|nr:mechanosensitive ion channel [Anaerolineae bacterium]